MWPCYRTTPLSPKCLSLPMLPDNPTVTQAPVIAHATRQPHYNPSVCPSPPTGVPTLPTNAPCCDCPGRMRECVLPETGPANGCYKNAAGLHKNYASFRLLYEEYCLQSKTVDPANWSYGNCPDGVPMVPPPGCK